MMQWQEEWKECIKKIYSKSLGGNKSLLGFHFCPFKGTELRQFALGEEEKVVFVVLSFSKEIFDAPNFDALSTE